MIEPPILLGCFYRHHVADILYYANSGSIPLWIGADLANFSIRYVMTYLTVLHLSFQCHDGISESLYGGRILTKQMQNKPHSRFTSYTRQLGKFTDRLFE